MQWGLVGRNEELAYLEDVLADERYGGALIGGAAGVGKTRLQQEILSRRGDAHVETASATASARELPLGALAHLVPEGRIWDERAGLMVELAAILRERAEGRPIVLAVDDAHHLDPLSAAFVHHVAATRLAKVVLTVRSGEAAPDAIVALYRDGVTARLELQPLARREFDELLEEVLGGPVERASADRLWEVASGNLLFVRELLLDAMEAGRLEKVRGIWCWSPGVAAGVRLREVVAANLGDLSTPQRDLLELLAVGEPLGLETIERLVPTAVVGEAERRGLVTVETSGRRVDVRLSHPLYGEVVSATLPVTVRREIQRALARELSATTLGRPGDLLRLAVLQQESGMDPDVAVLVPAAREALAMLDTTLAERLARAAVEAGGGFAAEMVLGRALEALGHNAEAEAVLGPLEGSEPDDTAIERVAYARALVVGWGLGRVDDALAILARAADRTSAPAARALIEGHAATLLAYAGRFDEAAALGTTALERVDDEAVRLRSLTSVGISLVMTGRIEEALRMSDEALPVALRLQQRLPRAPRWVVANRTAALLLGGRFQEAIALLDLAVATVGSASPDVLAEANTYRGRALLAQGRAKMAFRLLADAAATTRDDTGPVPASWCLSLAAEAAALAGDVDTARHFAAEAIDLRSPSVPAFDADARRARAWVAVAEGALSRAITELEAAADEAAGRGQRVFELVALDDALRLGARQHAARVHDVAASVDGAWAAAIVLHATAVVSGTPDDYVRAADAFAAIDVALVAAELYERASVGFGEAALKRRSAEMSRLRDEQLARCEGAVTPGLRLGTAAAAGLSRREREVAELAAHGITNADIAAQLHLSVRTVESHLYSAFGKLGISDRADLRTTLSRIQ